MHVKTFDLEKVFFGIVYSYNCGVHTCGLYESDLDVLRVHLHIISGRVIIQAPYFIHSYISLLRYSLTVGSKTVSLNIHASTHGTRCVYTYPCSSLPSLFHSYKWLAENAPQFLNKIN